MSLLCLTCAKCKVVIFKIKINFSPLLLFNPQKFRLFLAFFRIGLKNQSHTELNSVFCKISFVNGCNFFLQII